MVLVATIGRHEYAVVRAMANQGARPSWPLLNSQDNCACRKKGVDGDTGSVLVGPFVVEGRCPSWGKGPSSYDDSVDEYKPGPPTGGAFGKNSI